MASLERLQNRSPALDLKLARLQFYLRWVDPVIRFPMRVVEVGLDALAKRLRIPRQKNWGDYLRRITESLDGKKKPLPKWVKRTESFFRDSAMIIARIKDKWRNPCVHRINKHYSPNQAEDVFNEVKKLMIHLSTKLKQRRRKSERF